MVLIQLGDTTHTKGETKAFLTSSGTSALSSQWVCMCLLFFRPLFLRVSLWNVGRLIDVNNLSWLGFIIPLDVDTLGNENKYN